MRLRLNNAVKSRKKASTIPARPVALPLLIILALIVLGCLAGCGGSDDSNDKSKVAGGPAAQMVHDYGQVQTQSLDRGKATACSSNLSQLRTAIIGYRGDNENKFPASLADLGPAMRVVTTCPSNNQPYTYDPETGTVKCTNPGHEKL
ncbi:MAG: hypothetical protein M3Y56_00865 [Armatimonadota bacterium]|nr:hypothetical protein [Armatimonadota bacterium]